MDGIETWTIEPTAQDVVLGLLAHAWALAAVMLLFGLLFHSRLLLDEKEGSAP